MKRMTETNKYIKTFEDDPRQIILCLVQFQSNLIKELFYEYPNPIKSGIPMGVPKTGKITSNEQMWTFHRHGRGVSFKSTNNVIVDIHQSLEEPSYFDSWRLEQFCSSLDINIEKMEDELSRLISINRILIIDKIRGILALSDDQ